MLKPRAGMEIPSDLVLLRPRLAQGKAQVPDSKAPTGFSCQNPECVAVKAGVGPLLLSFLYFP